MADVQALEQQLASLPPAERLPIFLELGRLYEELGDVRNMARCFYEASAIDPRSLIAVQGARRAYLRAEKWEGAIAWFQAELRLQPDLEARAALLSELGDLRRNRFNDPEGAQTFYGQASQLRAEARERTREATAPPPSAPPPQVVVLAPPKLPPEPPVVRDVTPMEAGTRRSVPLWAVLLLLLGGGGMWGWSKFKPRPLCPPGQMHRTDAFLLPEDLGAVARDEGCWVDARRVGFHRFFDDAGVATAEITFREGLRQGPAHWVALDGGWESGSIEADQRTGEWITRTPAGVMLAKANYRNGLRNGPERIFFPDGGTYIDAKWAAGLQEGEWSQYYDDGKIWMRGDFKAGAPAMRWQRFDRTGAFVWVTPEARGPHAIRSAGSLFAGRTLAWWNVRLAELRSDARRSPNDPGGQARLELTLHRSALCDLEVDPSTQMLRPVVASE